MDQPKSSKIGINVVSGDVIEVQHGRQVVQLARWSTRGPGYLPGRCSVPVGGRVWRTADFPMEAALRILARGRP